MGQAHIRSPRERARIAAAFYAVAFIGISTGARGVELPDQMADYAIDKSTVGLMFLTFSAGYIACAAANGVLIHHLGIRMHLMVGTALSLGALALSALRPGFAIFLILQSVYGFGIGALDAGLNSFLSTLSRSAALLNYFHAFFGVGALAGPVLAAQMLAWGLPWNVFFGFLAVLLVPLLVSMSLYPATEPAGADQVSRPAISGALRLSAVWLAATFLAVYVGLESSMGNWGFTFLTEARGQPVLTAGWIVSAFWAGLTLGRFTLNALAERFGVGVVGLSAVCIGGVAVSALGTWLVPTATAATVGMITLGFFLGPLYPTIIAALPGLVPERLVATAIGVLVAVSLVGGALFPYAVGASAQWIGAWSLVPICFALAGLLGLFWWRIARRMTTPALAATSAPTVRLTPSSAAETSGPDLPAGPRHR
jgi:fucose permease